MSRWSLLVAITLVAVFGIVASCESPPEAEERPSEREVREEESPATEETVADPAVDEEAEPEERAGHDEPAPYPEGTPLEAVVPGVWLMTWSYSHLVYTDEDGEEVEELSPTPHSYGFMGEIQMDAFFVFREDGTGAFFDRTLRITDQPDPEVTVVERMGDGEYEERDVARVTDLTWELDGNTIHIDAPEARNPQLREVDSYQVTWNRTPERSGGRQASETPEGHRLLDELHVEPLGYLIRVEESDAQGLLKRYEL